MSRGLECPDQDTSPLSTTTTTTTTTFTIATTTRLLLHVLLLLLLLRRRRYGDAEASSDSLVDPLHHNYVKSNTVAIIVSNIQLR